MCTLREHRPRQRSLGLPNEYSHQGWQHQNDDQLFCKMYQPSHTLPLTLSVAPTNLQEGGRLRGMSYQIDKKTASKMSPVKIGDDVAAEADQIQQKQRTQQEK